MRGFASLFLLAPLVALSIQAHADDSAEQACIPALNSYCAPEVISAIQDAWDRSAQGLLDTEAGFCVFRKEYALNGKSYCSYKTEPLPYTGEYLKITFKLPADCIAIYHTHPNKGDPNPSDGDIETAKKVHLPVYVISRVGLRRTRPQVTQKIEIVRKETQYLQSCSGAEAYSQ